MMFRTRCSSLLSRTRHVRLPFALLAATLLCAAGAPLDCQPAWAQFGDSGMNHFVRALAVYDDGSGHGPALYAGGHFSHAGGVQVNGMAKWNGTSWEPIGTGFQSSGPFPGVRALAVFDDGSGRGPELYAAGQFNSMDGVVAEGIAKWNGRTWVPVGNGTMEPANSTVNTLMVFDDGTGGGPALFMGGGFTSVGGVQASRIAKWNGSAWQPLGGGTSSAVYALAAYDDGQGAGTCLYASGIFPMADGHVVNFVAKWSNGAWSGLGGGITGGVLGVYSLAAFDPGNGSGPALYAGGDFTLAGGNQAIRIAKWNGTAWSAVGNGVTGGVYTMTVFDDGTGQGPALYAGGTFSGASGVAAGGIARWSGTAWSGLDGGTNGTVFALVDVSDFLGIGPTLCVAGSFQTTGSLSAGSIAMWQGCPQEPCVPADLNCDGAVDGADLGALLGNWGVCPGCPADLNGDGAVDGADLGSLLGAWTG